MSAQTTEHAALGRTSSWRTVQAFAAESITVPKNRPAPKTLISQHFPSLWAAFPSSVMIPTLQSFEGVTSPGTELAESALDSVVTINALEDEVRSPWCLQGVFIITA